jgi:predicted phage terminase large subunit-like protein
MSTLTSEALLAELATLDDDQLTELLESLPTAAAQQLLTLLGTPTEALPATPLEQAFELDENYRERPHLKYLSDRLAAAVADVENGIDRKMIIEMPPRSGKTTLATIFTPLWTLRHHPDWPIALTSHDGNLATSWGRQVRRHVEQNDLGLAIARDAGAAREWETSQGGKVFSASVRESFTGRGAKLLVVDDPHKDYADAHSAASRNAIWDWWLSVALLRQNPPALVVVIMTRWHEDDLVGRVLSREYEGDPSDWERIQLPAIAEEHDILGRTPGDPLYSPLIVETREQALERWQRTKINVGSYVWSALMQQSPSPARGSIFDADWWRFWSSDPNRATDDGKIIYLDPGNLSHARWLDSWDMAFKATQDSDYVVGQRWARDGTHRYLIAQQRARMTFTRTLAAMEDWGDGNGPHGRFVHERLVEDKANGTAVLDTLKEKISGLIPVQVKAGDPKEARARSVTPEVEAGNVYLPHPGDPGNEWVTDLLSELREFPSGAHDDQVDALTQALRRMRDPGIGRVFNPGSNGRQLVAGVRSIPGRTAPRRIRR